MREQWKKLGVDPDQVKQAQPPETEDDQDEDLELSDELWPAWECFLATWTQWRVIAGLAQVFYEGIDYASLLAVMDMHGIKPKKRRTVLMQVRILEDEARKLRNKQ
ncbi:MAG: DUF1799 domain-containing protein [Comamonas sp.]|uniref:DUF1799 domain-containing protein n=1 Tax=Comamonas sp. TaxID=34028 RepID=UPI002FCC4F50